MRNSCPIHSHFRRGCDDCRAHSARYRRTRAAGLRDGTWDRMVAGEDLEQVRAHLLALLALPGVTAPLVAQVVGTTHHTVYRVASGERTKLGHQLAQAILDTTPAACRALVRTPAAMVDSAGASRMLQALMADGWDSQSLSDLSGLAAKRLGHIRNGVNPHIRRSTYDTVRSVYDKIQSLADPSGPSAGAAVRARTLGYLPPERWADEDIDNPDAQPLPPEPETDDHVEVSRLIRDALEFPAPGKAADYDRAVKREIARHAVNRLGWSWERVAELLGYRSPSTAEYLLRGRPDRPPVRREQNRRKQS